MTRYVKYSEIKFILSHAHPIEIKSSAESRIIESPSYAENRTEKELSKMHNLSKAMNKYRGDKNMKNGKLGGQIFGNVP